MRTREIIPLKTELDLTLTLPGSKSVTNRAFLCAALAKGASRISGALKSDDTRVMLAALKKLGLKVKEGKGVIEIGGGGGRFKPGALTLDAGASGTTTRFLTALSVLRKGKTLIKGTKRMKERPIKDLEDALVQLQSGEKVIRIRGDKSSQFLSALLMISPYFGPLRIEVTGKLVSKPYIATTLAVMKAFGVKVKNNGFQSFEVGRRVYKAIDYFVEGDASAASYFSALNFLHGGTLKFTNLNYKKSIQGDIDFPEALKQLKRPSPRRIDMEAMPDAALTLACVAPFVKGETRITGLSTLQLKETDRLAALEKELKKLGVKARKTKDSLTVFGIFDNNATNNVKKATNIVTYDDHRMAMAFAVLGTKRPGVIIEDPECTSKTYPDFWEDLEKAYLKKVKIGWKNLLLTGMRGSGKTFYGKKIAGKLGRKFVDLDLEIERQEKMKISEIVKRKGWPYFRKIEQKICSEFSGAKNLVIATGGGVVLSPKNMKALQKNSMTIFIYADPEVLVERVKKSSDRPSLTGKKSENELRGIWEERRELYLKYADVVWDDTGGKSLQGFDFLIH
jgi:3-phosphoshikimate 1-carboxyvinyltransferase